jgi:DNA modification methylase
MKTHRHYVEYDINEEYTRLAERRIKEFSLSLNIPHLFSFEAGRGEYKMLIV